MKIHLILILLCSYVIKAQSGNYGSLAIDPNNGFYYGWAIDYKSQSEANSRALKECTRKGGKCKVVLKWTGGKCAVYRTIKSDVGTAYGWGVAENKVEADRIANSECRKRSNGEPCGNFVWGCNSKSKIDEDFWNGGSSEKDDTGSDKNEVSNFWNGKGTVKEEDYFNHYTKPKESNQFIGEIRSKTKYITIFCQDHGEEDGDLVALYNNKDVIKSKVYLTNAGKSIQVELKWGMNRIDFKALNQGDSGPNTAKFDVIDDNGNLISSKEWNLLTGYTGTLLITKF